jgi:hypothetical protein
MILFLISAVGSASAQTCFEPSPSVENGVDPHSPPSVSEITDSQYQAIEKILINAEGKWSGKMVIKECLGTPDSPRTVEEVKDVKADADYRNGQLKIELEMHSHKNKTKQTDAIQYFLSENRFSVDPSVNTGDVRVVKITDNAVYFYLRRLNYAGKAYLAKEMLASLEAVQGQLIIKELRYVNGALASSSVLTLQ